MVNHEGLVSSLGVRNPPCVWQCNITGFVSESPLWREFSNNGNTENDGRKGPLQIHVSADGRDLSLLRTEAAEKTVESGSKARGSVPRGKSRSLNSGAMFSAG